jgi:HlyD family secretion protein
VAAWALRAPPAIVETAAVTRAPFELAVSDDGRTRVRDRYVVSAPLAGALERITLRAGDPVQRGTVLATLMPAAPPLLDARTAREMQERVGAAEAQLARAKAERQRIEAQRDQARADEERQRRLADERFVSATAAEQARLALRTAERAVEGAIFGEDAAGHDLAQARAALARYRRGGGAGEPAWKVTSPVSGVVLRVMQESEAVVGLGTPLLEVADPRGLEAIVDVVSQQAVLVEPGMPARVELSPGLPPLAARVRRVEPAAFTKVSALGIEEQRVNVVLDLSGHETVPNLGDGFRVEAHIIVFRAPDALKVPVGALFRDGTQWAVFVIEDGRARRRVVNAPRRNGVEALVESGLSEGERVIVYPPDAVRDGARVEVR